MCLKFNKKKAFRKLILNAFIFFNLNSKKINFANN